MNAISNRTTPFFSVIVPVYNCEQYVDCCINSILSQDYKKFELVLVDDGSTDNSYDICRKYSAADSRVKTLQKTNGGPFLARLAAYPLVAGDYVLHVDADDCLAPFALCRLADVISHYTPDVVFFRLSRDKTFKHTDFKYPFSESTFFGPDAKASYLNLIFDDSCCLNSMCTKAIKTNLLKERVYPPRMSGMVTGEDLLQSLYVLGDVETAYYLDEALYYYRVTTTGTTLTFRLSDHRDHEVFYEACRELLNDFRALPGFVLTDTDNDSDFIFSCFRFLQKASRQGKATFLQAADIVHSSNDLVNALHNDAAKNGLRMDAALVITLVLSNAKRVAYAFLVAENKLRVLQSRKGGKRQDNREGDMSGM